MSTLSLTYNWVLKRTESRKVELPDLKSSNLLLKSFELKTDQKELDLKIIGRDTIASYGEAIFYQTTKFDLTDKLSQIIDAEKISVSVKNLCTSATKDAGNVNLSLSFLYTKVEEGFIIYNNIYTNLNPTGLDGILTDIKGCGKYITKIIWTSPGRLSSIELTPQFISNPNWLSPIVELVNQQNQVIMDLTDSKYDPDLVSQLGFYSLKIPENIDKLGVIVYGFNH